MKKSIISTFKTTAKDIISDGPFLSVMVASLVFGIVFIVYALLTIEHRDIQVVARYSAFGEAHFYKEQWWTLYSFVLFEVVAVVSSLFLMVKLRSFGRRDLALMLGGLSCFMTVIAFAYAYEVLRVAFI